VPKEDFWIEQNGLAAWVANAQATSTLVELVWAGSMELEDLAGGRAEAVVAADGPKQ
jgi:hypothetical protein